MSYLSRRTSGHKTVEVQASILGGLPVIVVASFDWDGGDYYNPPSNEFEITDILWLNGRKITQKVWDKAEKFDPGFLALAQEIQSQREY